MAGCGKDKSNPPNDPKNLIDQVNDKLIVFNSYLTEAPEHNDSLKNEILEKLKSECPMTEDLQKLLNYLNCQIPQLKLKANPKISIDKVDTKICQSHVDGITESCLVFTVQSPTVL